jgi:hypothetical protein
MEGSMKSNGHRPSEMREILHRNSRQAAGSEFASVLKRLRTAVVLHKTLEPEDPTGLSAPVLARKEIEWTAIAEILDRFAPEWGYTLSAYLQVDEFVAAIAAITILGVTREGVGLAAVGSRMDLKNAEYEALIQAAVKF